MTVTLRPFVETDRDAVLDIEVTESQLDFVSPMATTLATTALKRDNYVIEAEGRIVGFFQIDRAKRGQIIADHLELHEVTIDCRQQGKGYGRSFMSALLPLLQMTYADWSQVCLTVNCRNEPAYRLYLSVGFEDTGEITERGGTGPQRIMRRNLT